MSEQMSIEEFAELHAKLDALVVTNNPMVPLIVTTIELALDRAVKGVCDGLEGSGSPEW